MIIQFSYDEACWDEFSLSITCEYSPLASLPAGFERRTTVPYSQASLSIGAGGVGWFPIGNLLVNGSLVSILKNIEGPQLELTVVIIKNDL